MSANPYMPLYVADYLADTAHLTTLESGAYMLLIMHYWRRGGPLDNSNGRLANVARMSNDEWSRVEPVLAEFFQIAPDSVWHHKRIDAELQRASDKSRKAASAGRASAQRRLNGRSTDAQPEGNLSESGSYLDKEKKGIIARTESDAAREMTDGRTAAYSDLKSKFNGTTEAMLAFVETAMGPNSRTNAEQWLAGTVSAHGSGPVAQAFAMIAEKRAAGEISTRPLGQWSNLAGSLKAGRGQGSSVDRRPSWAVEQDARRKAAMEAVYGRQEVTQ